MPRRHGNHAGISVNSWALLREHARLSSWEESACVLVAALLPNDFGLFDMLGNLMEWCHDADYDYPRSCE